MAKRFVNSDSLDKIFLSYNLSERTAVLKESESYDENSIIYIHDNEYGNWIYAKGHLYGIDYDLNNNLSQLEEFICDHHETLSKQDDKIRYIEDYTKLNVEDLSTKISTVEFDTQIHHQTTFNISINEKYDHTYSYEVTNNYDQYLLEYNKQLCRLRNLQLISAEEFLYKMQYSITPVVNLAIYPYDSSSINADCVAILINYVFDNSGEIGGSFGQKLHIFVQDGKYVVFARIFDNNNLVFENWQLISYGLGVNVDPTIIDNINSSINEIKNAFEQSRQYVVNEFNNVNSSINDISTRLNNLKYYAGQNISINDNNEISALGYIYDNEKKCFIEGTGDYIEWLDASNAMGVDMRVDISGTAAATTYTYTGDSEKIQNFENNINYVQPYYDIYLKISSNRIAQYVSNSLDVENKTFNVVRSFDVEQDINNEVLVQAGGKQSINIDNVSIGAHIEGTFNTAHGEYSHVECGYNNTYGNYAHAEGCDNTAKGECSHVEGVLNDANGYASHAEGSYTHAYGYASHTEGNNTETRGNFTHAEGSLTVSNGNYSHAEGYGTTTNNEAEHAEGKWNISHDSDFVDLGLPSKTLWAKYNLGVNPNKLDTSIDWFGGYYAWGETEPKDNYGWSTYKYGPIENILKYNAIDEKIILDSSDNAVIALYGNDYTMPTLNNIQQLINHTHHEWVTNYNGISGLNGYKFMRRDNHSIYIFIPAAGISNAGYIGTECRLWTKTLSTEDDRYDFANSLCFDNINSPFIYRCDRSVGCSIRAITKIPQYVTQHSIGIGESQEPKNAIEVMSDGDMYIYGVGGYQGTDTKVQNASIMTLQEYIASLEARIATLEGNTIS